MIQSYSLIVYELYTKIKLKVVLDKDDKFKYKVCINGIPFIV